MRIQMVGTGAIAAKERSAAALIDDTFLIDCGNGIYKTLLEQGIDPLKIETLLVSHIHGDHFLDVPFLIIVRSFTPCEKPLKIIAPEGLTYAMSEITRLMYSDIEPLDQLLKMGNTVIEEYESLKKETVNGYTLTSYEMDHGDFEPSYGFVISDSKKTLGYSGDSTYCKEVEKIMKKSDAAVMEMSFVKEGASHMGVDSIQKLARKYPNKMIVTTHMSTSAREEGRKRNLSNVIIPTDGDVIHI